MLNALLWYFWTQVFALGGSFVAALWLRNLPDRGYGIGKAVGLLLGGYFYWILVTLGLAQNNSGAVLMALGMLLVIGYWLRRSNNQQPTTNNLIAIIATELLFALAFILCALYRAYNPEIQSSGGEKFMESLMLNAITRSSHFPPNDAWLSGFAISYYYFGYVILAMLTKISGIAPSIAFNLSGATIFALVMTSAFSVGFNLWKSHERRAESDEQEATLTAPRSQLIAHSSPLAAGLLTAIMLGLMGNMGGFMGVLRCGNVLPASVWQWLDVRELATQNTQCTGLRPSAYFYEWWWDWSRVVKDYALTTSDQGKFNTVEVITETPAFSFVLGDNHPHTLALPFVLIAIAFAMNAVSRNRTPSRSPIPEVLLGAIVVGGLAFLNTWDFPVYGALMVGGLVLGR